MFSSLPENKQQEKWLRQLCKWKDWIQICTQWNCRHASNSTSQTLSDSGELSRLIFSLCSNYKCVTNSRGAVHGPRPRLLGSPHQHCQTRGSLSRCSNSHYEHYARYEWMVLEPMGSSPTLQQQPRNRPFGGVTCSQVICLHCRGTCR